ncbi:MAG: M20/M25/M40 family metallo-hydrolase [Planctomycetota bacterium]|nr:M20/M25/M40 family metallo-hydrolase [Planctomycetota bacterium]
MPRNERHARLIVGFCILAGGPLCARAGEAPARPRPAAVDALLAEAKPARLKAGVEKLAGFGTRHTLSETGSETRGIGAARRWIKAEFERAAEAAAKGTRRKPEDRLHVSFESFQQPADGRRYPREVELVNVVAVLPGTRPEARARRVYVVGHYDSRASEANDAAADAPGANDNASGTALVLELARVLAGRELDATVVFLATAGEEQGLTGARRHAQAARQRGEAVLAVLNNDIVGDPRAPGGKVHDTQVRVFSEGLPAALGAERLPLVRGLSAESDGLSRQLARFVQETARLHELPVEPMLIYRSDRFLRGGDHLAFNEFGYPAVRFTVVEEDYTKQHQDVREEGGVKYGDLPAHVDAEYLAGVARVNLAALVHLANAPAPPAGAQLVMAELANDATLRWQAGPDRDTAGYEIVWRATTSPVWEGSKDVGQATEAVLPMSVDNYFFGVRAYDADGYRSMVAFPAVGRD